MITAGVTDFSRFITAADAAAGAAAAGTQYGALSPAHSNFAGMQNAATIDAANYPGTTAVASQFCACTVGGSRVACPPNCNLAGGETPETYIQVTVTIPFTPLFPYPGMPTGTSITSSSAVRVQ